MKIIKAILIVIAILALIMILMNTLGPKESVMSRSTTIDASKEVVWDHIRSLEGMNKWSPWMEMDPSAESGIDGIEGEVGSKGWWKGEVVGEGTQTISEVIPYESMSVDMEFMMGDDPAPADAKIAMAVQEDNMVEVVWSFHMDLPWMWRGMSLVMGDGEAGAAYEKGLATLKEMCENAPEPEMDEEITYTIMTIDREGARYLGIRKTVSFNDMGDHFQEHMPKVGMACGAMMTGPPVGLYYTWDEENEESDLAVAAPVAEGEAEGMEVFEIEGGQALMVEYFGAYDGSYDAHMAIDAHMKENGLEMRDVVIEEYVTDPGTEPDTSKWQTNIYYMIK